MFLTRKSLVTAFSQFGDVESLNYQQASDFGFVKFRNPGSVIDVFNKVLYIGECTIHTFHPVNQLKSGETVPYQIMIRSKNLPKYWEKSIISNYSSRSLEKSLVSTFGVIELSLSASRRSLWLKSSLVQSNLCFLIPMKFLRSLRRRAVIVSLIVFFPKKNNESKISL